MSQLSQPSEQDRWVTVEPKAQLYMGKFRYRARLTVSGLSRTRYRKSYAAFVEEADIRLNQKTKPGSWDHEWQKKWVAEYRTFDLSAIEAYYQWRQLNQQDTKLVSMRLLDDTATFFSNDLELLKTLRLIGSTTITEAALTLDPEVKLFKNQPKHNYRVYFREAKCSRETMDSIAKFLDTNSTVTASPATSIHLRTPNKWSWYTDRMMASHFIDYDDEGMYLVMMLHFGKHLGKRYRLEKA